MNVLNMARWAATAGTALVTLLGFAAAEAQNRPKLPRVWDIQLGVHANNLPSEDFVDPACGTDGGPPSRPLSGFAEFAKCPANGDGLHEVHFIYDDELEYEAKAIGDQSLIERYSGTRVLDVPMILSLLFDTDGFVQGIRMVSDPRAAARIRRDVYTLRLRFKAIYDLEGWDCVDLPKLKGERPIAGRYVKETCGKVHNDDKRLRLATRFYFKPGQSDFDRFTGKRTEGYFESSVRLEIYSLSVPEN